MMAQRIFLVIIVVLIVGVIPADQRTAPGAGFVVIILAVLAQGFILGSGIILGPDTGPAAGTSSGVFAETVRAQGLSVKDGAFRYGMDCSAVSADKGVVHGIPPIV